MMLASDLFNLNRTKPEVFMLQANEHILSSWSSDLMDKNVLIDSMPSQNKYANSHKALSMLMSQINHDQTGMILFDDRGFPIMPYGMQASIAHIHENIWVSLSLDQHVKALGLSIELECPKEGYEIPEGLTAYEQMNYFDLVGYDDTYNWAQVFTVLKTSAQKAINQAFSLNIDLLEIQVDINYWDQKFSITCSGIDQPAVKFEGFYVLRGGYIYALTIIKDISV